MRSRRGIQLVLLLGLTAAWLNGCAAVGTGAFVALEAARLAADVSLRTAEQSTRTAIKGAELGVDVARVGADLATRSAAKPRNVRYVGGSPRQPEVP